MEIQEPIAARVSINVLSLCDSSPSPTNLDRTILDLNSWEEPYRIFIEDCPADEGMVMQRGKAATPKTQSISGAEP